ncbi:Polymerase/histidinol phosphatase-like protein [Zychaea mexicana]|uniref:Polymerase/histidinol phosphatase-like protein n=1 Tax=Zychaea mexicana TaxID=64656 RepID=UPI0022FE6E01|nr:Polymerase/histidinol phosphatase-like protein [Zychaea mexicana]KAI9489809.1 Polymerase/histidinol phosphatase-like protein [Zychaea mexicana]
MPYSYHSHSGQYCHHGYGLLEDVVKEAIRKGFHAYGLSEHMPRFADSELYPEEIEAKCTPATLNTQFEQFHAHARQLVKKYSGQIDLIVGTEIEFIHTQYAEYIREIRSKVDYVVGSLHHVGSVPIDFSPELYKVALERYGDIASLFSAYFDEQYEMLVRVQPEVVGHFDLVRIFASSEEQQTLSQPDIWNKVKRNIDYIVRYGGIFEINSRAWKKGLRDAYPCRDVIKYIQEKGGHFTLSDDCHGPQDVGMHYDKLKSYLKETDIEVIHYLAREGGRIVVRADGNILNDPFWDNIANW